MKQNQSKQHAQCPEIMKNKVMILRTQCPEKLEPKC